MLRFFRHIRKTLMEHLPAGQAGNKVRTYLLYAIGEIALVMIGILLALQVNNWNEERKSREFEYTLLNELEKAVQSDIAFFQDHLLNNRNAGLRECHQYFERMIKGEEVDKSDFNRCFGWLKYGNTFHVNDGAYESIKSSGIDKISNTQIRNYITKFYEFDMPRYEELLSYILDELDQAVKQHLPELLEPPVASVDSGLLIEQKPIDFDVKTNQHFLILLDRSMVWESYSSQRYISIVEKYLELDSLLSNEMTKEFRN